MTRTREGRAMANGGDVRVAVLGTIEVSDGDASVALSPQLRRLLGLLVVAGGGVVSADRLAEYVADGNVEGSTVRTAVSRLRKVLGERIESVDGGYRLVMEPDELDAARFEQLVARARSATGDVEVAALSRALELWRGPALGELAGEEWASGWAHRLDGLRATAMEDLAETLLREGRSREATELLDEHVRGHPYRERPVELLMRALAADGRVADGLRVFERFRVTLRDDTGLEPSAELRVVEAELLAVGAPGTGATVLPSGTVTFLFTDIEGSTQRWAEDESAMTAALADHDQVLREVVASHGGVVFKHTGDGVCAVFASAAHATSAAIDAQRRLELPVRMGVHTGEAELRDGDYFGPTLNRVARIMDAGHGGQVLLSRATAALVPDVEAADLGEHRLKGLSSPERIFQIGSHEFPALRVATARKGNLPAEITEFVGRREEVADVVDRLSDHRVLTLLGVGGAGKTRLAVEVGHLVAPRFPDGCWLVELARVLVAEAVPHAVCVGLGLQVPEAGDVVEHVVNRLRHQRLLIVLDNCEHVLDAAAAAVESILAACPAVTILATSREPLMVAGEHLVPTPSLAADDAVALFVDRLGAEAPSIVVDGEQERSIAAICARLDHLPLAIELAASRARSMSPVEIEARLDERFRLLVGGRRSRMERHQTMRGTVDWSYDLCSPVERHVFDRVSVFAGTFDLDGAIGVAADDDHDRFDVEDALHRLVDRSLVQRVLQTDGSSRYRLLETMRAYGRERLADDGGADVARRRHAEHVAGIAAALGLRAIGPDDLLVREQTGELAPDLVLALDWCVERDEWSLVPKLCSGVTTSVPGIGMGLVRRVAPHLPPITEAMAGVPPLLHLGLLSNGRFAGGDFVEDREFAERYVELVREGETIPFDALYLLPNVESAIGVADLHEMIARFLAGLGAAPLALRWFATYVASMAIVNTDSEWMQPILDEFEELTNQVGGVVAIGRHRAQIALLQERRGELAEAERNLREALSDSAISWGDVLTALRIVRITGRRHGALRGEDLRRPIRWEREVTNGTMIPVALASCGVGLHASGHVDLARRCAGVVKAAGLGSFYATLFGATVAPDLGPLFADADLLGDDPDSVLRDILELADELDAAAEEDAP